MSPGAPEIRETRARTTRPEDFDAIVELCRAVYPDTAPWGEEQLSSHLRVFPEGQLVAVEVDPETGREGRLLGMAASLILSWDDYDHQDAWRDFTDHGLFTNHDPSGRTLYGAEVMVHPSAQGRGVGSEIYRARRELARRLGMRRIRAGARLRGYHRWADRLSAAEYVERVVAGEIRDPTLSFQLHRGFRVIDVVKGYLANDPESRGWAAVIEWLNPDAE
jgi:GNAT superfamily N-acetyltransferase